MTSPVLLGVSLLDRRRALDPSLRALADGLRAELAPLHARAFPVPPHKAMLTRAGGRCAHDGVALRFDPWSPHTHTCPRCGRTYRGVAHDQWWAMGAQLWCAERTLHAALLGRLFDDETLVALAARGLDTLGSAWPTYPNRDNALGPTRPFFSTYLESVWLLTVSLAAQCLADRPAHARLLDALRDTVIAPSRALIASFPEGRSNRQAWHVAARMIASQLLDDDAHARDAVDGAHGLRALLHDGLLPDGTWFEGENYHLFAHRGLWFALMAAGEGTVPAELVARFDRGFATPWLGVLPDGTFPSRRDARYAVSVHQWRFAEWCELGLARRDDAVLRRWLHRLYHAPHAEGDTGRARSTAEIERDEPPVALTRADLGWRTLLCARNAPWPAPSMGEDESVRLDAQGLAVLRRDAGRVCVALEGGDPGGGHGHPDRLSLTIQDGARRILEDPGTGSYVERTLHWYRSTLAHNAPLIDGASQRRVPTRTLAFASAPDGGVVQGEASGIAPGVIVRRTVVLCDTHVVDWCAWYAARDVRFELPMHGDARAVADAVWTPALPDGAGGLEDGFDFLSDVARTTVPPAEFVRFEAGDGVTWWSAPTDEASATLWRAIAPGPPGRPARTMHWWRARGTAGAVVTVWSLRGAVRAVSREGDTVRVHGTDGREWRHVAGEQAWRVTQGDAVRVTYSIAPLRPTSHASTTVSEPSAAPPAERPPTSTVVLTATAPHWQLSLGERHYRRSECSWQEAGAPSATVALTLENDGGLRVAVDARTGAIVAPDEGATNPFDNERAEVNGDGVQWYIGPADGTHWTVAQLLVPSLDGTAGRVV
ncbi:MAG TPA: heparinase II/III family protein, partial [Gemmatimonadaceae bacterium]|nr:heparinase II/III family protein [Gemmatimonadaceae bacterium]